jgi:hypothetical protein
MYSLGDILCNFPKIFNDKKTGLVKMKFDGEERYL